MPVRSERWAVGTPCWVDLGVEDLAAAREFYRVVLGWDYVDSGPEAGGYLRAVVGGQEVAGLGPKMNPGQPTAWLTYLATDNVEATQEKITAAGGQVWMPAMQVMDVGRMAVTNDAVQAPLCLWEAGSHIGFTRYNEPGTVCWNELVTTNGAGAKAFYGEVFGYVATTMGAGDQTYTTFALSAGAESIAGMNDTHPVPGLENFWLTWFAVPGNDCDASAATIEGAGGSVVVPAFDSPFGRMAIARGVTDETFGIIGLNAQG